MIPPVPVGPIDMPLLLTEIVGTPDVPAAPTDTVEDVRPVPSSTLLEMAVPTGAVPAGAVPIGAVPAGAVPIGAVPTGAVPNGAVLKGAVPETCGCTLGQYPFHAPITLESPKLIPVTPLTSVQAPPTRSKLTAWQPTELSQASTQLSSVNFHFGTVNIVAPMNATPQLIVYSCMNESWQKGVEGVPVSEQVTEPQVGKEPAAGKSDGGEAPAPPGMAVPAGGNGMMPPDENPKPADGFTPLGVIAA